MRSLWQKHPSILTHECYHHMVIAVMLTLYWWVVLNILLVLDSVIMQVSYWLIPTSLEKMEL